MPLVLLIFVPAILVVVIAAFAASKGATWGVVTVIVVTALGLQALKLVRVHVWDPDPGCDVECGGRIVFYVAWYAYIAASVVGACAVLMLKAIGRIRSRSSSRSST